MSEPDNTCLRCGQAIRREFTSHEVCECLEPLRDKPADSAVEEILKLVTDIEYQEKRVEHTRKEANDNPCWPTVDDYDYEQRELNRMKLQSWEFLKNIALTNTRQLEAALSDREKK